jgi:hypothetical protein
MSTALSVKDLEQRSGEAAAQWRQRLAELPAANLDATALAAFEGLLRRAEDAVRTETPAGASRLSVETVVANGKGRRFDNGRQVRLTAGPRAGEVGEIVAWSVGNETVYLVQFPDGARVSVREQELQEAGADTGGGK